VPGLVHEVYADSCAAQYCCGKGNFKLSGRRGDGGTQAETPGNHVEVSGDPIRSLVLIGADRDLTDPEDAVP
jgi:hypothetical protein